MAKKDKESKVAPVQVEGEARKQALEAVVLNVEKQHGKGSLMIMDGGKVYAVPYISTGALELDIALGIGGVPKGRIIEVFGPESSGKTTLTLMMIANAQGQGGTAAFVDAEHSLSPKWARTNGVDMSKLLISQPDTGEEALEITEALVRSGAVDIIVIDSVAALVPKAEIDGEMGDSHMGLQARLMSQALRKLAGIISKSNTCVVFINQIRHKIGVMFGSPETTTGGNALKFYASVRMDIRRTETLKNGEESIGNRTKVTVKKNKLAPPHKVAFFDLMYDSGISREASILELAVKYNIAEKAGTWYSYNEERMGQGKEKSRLFLVDNQNIAQELEAKIRDAAGLNDLSEYEPPTPEEVQSDKEVTEASVKK